MRKLFIFAITALMAGFYSCSNYYAEPEFLTSTSEEMSLKASQNSTLWNVLIASDGEMSYCSQNNICVDIYGNAYYVKDKTVRMIDAEYGNITDLFTIPGEVSMSWCYGIAVNSKQDVYLMTNNDHLYQLNSNGQLLRDLSNNSLIFNSSYPYISGINVDPNDNVFVLSSQGEMSHGALKKIAANGRITEVMDFGDIYFSIRGGGVFNPKGQYAYIAPTLGWTFYSPDVYKYANIVKNSGEFTIDQPGFSFKSLGSGLNNNKLYILRSNDNTIHSINPNTQQMILQGTVPTTAAHNGALIEVGEPERIFPTPDADAFYVLYRNGNITKLSF